MTEEWENELLNVAVAYFPDALELAVSTNDDDLFQKVLKAANAILVDNTLSDLIEKGLVEISGVDDTGDFYFQLTEEGKQIAEELLNGSDEKKSETE